MFVGKTGAYSSEALFRCSTPEQATGLIANITLGWKGLQGKVLQLIAKIRKLGHQKFYNIGPWNEQKDDLIYF